MILNYFSSRECVIILFHTKALGKVDTFLKNKMNYFFRKVTHIENSIRIRLLIDDGSVPESFRYFCTAKCQIHSKPEIQ